MVAILSNNNKSSNFSNNVQSPTFDDLKKIDNFNNSSSAHNLTAEINAKCQTYHHLESGVENSRGNLKMDVVDSRISESYRVFKNTTKFSVEYLSELLRDKQQLSPISQFFTHIDRLLDEELCKVRSVVFGPALGQPLALPDPEGPVVVLHEKVYVPIRDFPDFNFVGRILGPRGMTAKQLERETGCKIMIRGRGSVRNKAKEEANRGRPNWEHLNEDLHVLLQCEDTENRSCLKLQRAKIEIEKLMIPTNEDDDLKRKQLTELAILNGSLKTSSPTQLALATPRFLTTFAFTAAPFRSTPTPLILHSPPSLGTAMTSPVGTTTSTPSKVPSPPLSLGQSPDFERQQPTANALIYNYIQPTFNAHPIPLWPRMTPPRSVLPNHPVHHQMSNNLPPCSFSVSSPHKSYQQPQQQPQSSLFYNNSSQPSITTAPQSVAGPLNF